MRIATWNVNSVKQRVPRLLPWLDQRRPDVVCLQETKLADPRSRSCSARSWPSRGYAMALHGQGSGESSPGPVRSRSSSFARASA
jgi:exodeoxyribonuclease-3